MMAVRRASARGLAAATWVAVAVVPLAWALGVFLALLSGGGREAGSVALGLGGVAVFAGVPTIAVVLAVRLRQRGERSGRAAVVVSASLLGISVLVTLLVGTLATIIVVVVMALLGAYLWWSRARSGSAGHRV